MWLAVATSWCAIVVPTADAAGPPPTIEHVEVRGASALSADEARGAVSLVEGAAYDPDTATAAVSSLLSAYAARGYYFADASLAVEPPDGAAARVVVDVREGIPLPPVGVRFEGLRRFDEAEARHLLGVRMSGAYDARRWAAGLRRLSGAYAEAGHPLARVAVRLVEGHGSDFHILVDVEEGPQVSFEAVTFDGMRKTRPTYLAKLARIRVGDVYDSRRVADARSRLVNSGLFTSVHPVDVLRGSDAQRVVYRARVEEARTARFMGVLGYAPPASGTDTAQVTGLVEGVETNILGTGREAQVRWESGENRTNRFRYREPFLLGARVALELEWDAERYQGSRTRVARGSLAWEFGSSLTATGGVQALAADASSGRGALAALAYDTRDFRPNPARGMFVRVSADAVAGDIDFSRVEADARAFLPVSRMHMLMARVTAARVQGSNIPLTEWLFMGGSDMLRGYEDRQFRGTRRLTGTVEYRVRTGRLSHLFAFLDVGRVSGPAGAIAPKVGYGMGANLESRGGLVRFVYGIDPASSPLDGKVHLSLGTAL